MENIIPTKTNIHKQKTQLLEKQKNQKTYHSDYLVEQITSGVSSVHHKD